MTRSWEYDVVASGLPYPTIDVEAFTTPWVLINILLIFFAGAHSGVVCSNDCRVFRRTRAASAFVSNLRRHESRPGAPNISRARTSLPRLSLMVPASAASAASPRFYGITRSHAPRCARRTVSAPAL